MPNTTHWHSHNVLMGYDGTQGDFCCAVLQGGTLRRIRLAGSVQSAEPTSSNNTRHRLSECSLQ